MTSTPYAADFYRAHQTASRRSAQVLVPMLVDLFHPASIVDAGCGSGEWLAVFAEHGVGDYLGLDGPWVEPAQLAIPAHRFQPCDLAHPFHLPRTFDLVISLEVAEHLPAFAAAGFVRSLTELGPVVLFSAAVPGQGGVCHINEQWPGYWAAHFRAQGYEAIDCLRPRLWSHPDVEWWYAQNVLLFARPGVLHLDAAPCNANLDLVHRELYEKILEKYRAALQRADLSRVPLRKLLGALAPAAAHALRRRLPHPKGATHA